MALAADAPPLRKECPEYFSPGWGFLSTASRQLFSQVSMIVAGNRFAVSRGRAQKEESGFWYVLVGVGALGAAAAPMCQ